MKELKFKVHWSFLALGILMLVYGNFFNFVCCLTCVVLHEMGHSFVGRKLGYRLNVITLMPYGAMLSGSNAPFSENDEIKIAIAGPVVNAIIIVICYVFKLFAPTIFVYINPFFLANIYTFCFNILPVYPLDGGRIMLSVISKFGNRTRAYNITKLVGFIITGIIFLLFFISFIYELNYMLGINALFLLIGLLENDTEIYYNKLSNFEKFKVSFNKSIKLNANDTIFKAYKQIANNRYKEVCVRADCTEKHFKRDYIMDKILEVPINTKLKDLA